jgi:hypothetical protein
MEVFLNKDLSSSSSSRFCSTSFDDILFEEVCAISEDFSFSSSYFADGFACNFNKTL